MCSIYNVLGGGGALLLLAGLVLGGLWLCLVDACVISMGIYQRGGAVGGGCRGWGWYYIVK